MIVLTDGFWPAATHLDKPCKILQKEVIFTQKQPGCKKRCSPVYSFFLSLFLFKMASVKKAKGVAKKWLWWCRLMAKFLLTIQMNFVLIPGEARMRQHKLTRIIVIKIFAINLHHHSHFLADPFNFPTFSTLAILNGAAPFSYSQAVFE